MGVKMARVAQVYKSWNDVPSAAAYGEGALWVSGLQYWCDGALYRSANGALSSPRLIISQSGNSISELDRRGPGSLTGIQPRSILQKIQQLAGNPLQFVKVQETKATNTDIYGIYSHGGASSTVILTEIQAQWIDLLATAGVIPDVVFLRGFHENDWGDISLAQMKINFWVWYRAVKTAWPNAILWLVCPYPRWGLTSQQKIEYFELYQWYLDKDNGSTIFVEDAIAHADPADKSRPIYNLTSSQGAPKGDGIHPSVIAAQLLAKEAIYSVINRIAKSYTDSFVIKSANLFCTGSQAIEAGNTGVKPLAFTTTTTGLIGTKDPEDDSWIITASAPATGTLAGTDIGHIQCPVTFDAASQVAGFIDFEILSGGENIRSINLNFKVTDNGTLTSGLTNVLQTTSNFDGGGFTDGELITLEQTPVIKNPIGTGITSFNPYFGFTIKGTGGTVTLKIKRLGVKIIA